MSMSSFASLRGRTGYLAGLRDSIPVALSYFTVSLAFGLYCAQAGVSVFASGLMSFSNMSSTGQFGGLQVIIAHGTLFQLALTIILVNLRYLLMSVSLSQSLDRGDDGTGGFRMWQRLVIGWAVTDEIYALAMAKPIVTFAYYTGLMVLPILGWTGGAVTGFILGGTFLPMVMVGIHQGLTPIHAELLSRYGVTILLPILAMAGGGQVGAAIAVYAKTKNKALRKTIASALPVGLMGVGEPLIYGVTLPLGKPFIGACIGGAFGGAVQAAYMVGAATIGISGLPLAASTDNIPMYLLGLVTAYAAGFIATWLLGFDDPKEGE